MAFKIYKMSFHRAHFGKGYLNSSGMLFDASRLYSALCLEAIKNDCLDEFVNLSFKDDFYLSDAFPYVGEPYFPKPICYPSLKKFDLRTLKEDNDTNKFLNMITSVPLSMMSDFISGKAALACWQKMSKVFQKQHCCQKRRRSIRSRRDFFQSRCLCSRNAKQSV